jgi:hypothetical protein
MKRGLQLIGMLALIALASVVAYALHGYLSARADADRLAVEADRLIAEERGPDNLGPGRADQLLRVEDPGFYHHNGVDFTTAGSGLTTLTQSLGKRVGFRTFRPGMRKIRLVGYAMGLESKLNKRQILALYLDTVWMGRGRDGPINGFFKASQTVFGKQPAELTGHQFFTLLAVPIAPRTMTLTTPTSELVERTTRIERLLQGRCKPAGLRDVWLDACAVGQSLR